MQSVRQVAPPVTVLATGYSIFSPNLVDYIKKNVHQVRVYNKGCGEISCILDFTVVSSFQVIFCVISQNHFVGFIGPGGDFIQTCTQYIYTCIGMYMCAPAGATCHICNISRPVSVIPVNVIFTSQS